jgi:predicted RNA methylase
MDVGSGKGRVLLAAVELGFRSVIGMEIAPALTAVARRNLSRFARRRRFEARIVEADAAWAPSEDAATYVFFFNPFGSEQLGRFLDQLETSLRRSPRRLRVITYYTQAEGTFLGRGFAVVRRRHMTVLFERAPTLPGRDRSTTAS